MRRIEHREASGERSNQPHDADYNEYYHHDILERLRDGEKCEQPIDKSGDDHEHEELN